MPRNTRTFTDIDFNFLSHPKTKDVTLKNDEDAVTQSIRSLIMTKNYERPFRSYIGSPVTAMLFEQDSMLLTSMIERGIRDTINNFEPRASIISVKVASKPESNQLIAKIEYSLVNTVTPVSVNLILERTR